MLYMFKFIVYRELRDGKDLENNHIYLKSNTIIHISCEFQT